MDKFEVGYATAAILLIALKAGGWLSWGWLWALAPVLVPAGFLVVLAVAVGAFLLLTSLFGEIEEEGQ